MTAGEVQRAYGARAAEYAEHLGVMEAVAAPDRELVLSWAQTLTGPVLDRIGVAHLPAVQNNRVYALGTETFRLDYYSATLLLQRLSALF